jgi:hypothetical protein
VRHFKAVKAVTVALVALLAGIAGPAFADDVFYGCSKNLTSKVRSSSVLVNATPLCRSTETLRTWNDTGPQGPTGPSDAFSAYGDDTPLPSGGTFLSLAELSLSAGSYLFTAKASLRNDNAAITAIPYCAIVVGSGVWGLNDQTIATIDGVGTVALAALLPITLATSDVVQFRCTNNTLAGSDGDVTAQMVTLAAVRVGTLTLQ